METSVELQPLFAFSVIDVIIAAVLIVIAAGIVVFVFFSNKKTVSAPSPIPTFHKIPSNTRQRYLAMFDELSRKLEAGEIETRECCEEASENIRAFASKMTGMDLSTSTLKELDGSGMDGIKDAVEVCYTGEFPRVPHERAQEALSKCKDAVRGWK